jgi:hypothetical protein
MMRLGIIKTFNFNEDGDLLVPTEDGWGIFDIYNKDYDFVKYAETNIWPQVKVFSFADQLKLACHHIFGVPVELLYGNDEAKATRTTIRNLNQPETIEHCQYTEDDGSFECEEVANPDTYFTVRQLLQDFGTKCREINPDCWAERVLEKVPMYNSELSIIDDCRYPNEIDLTSGKDGVITIKFGKQIDSDGHSSETALDDLSDDKFDFIIDNEGMTLEEKNETIRDILLDIGWLQEMGEAE